MNSTTIPTAMPAFAPPDSPLEPFEPIVLPVADVDPEMNAVLELNAPPRLDLLFKVGVPAAKLAVKPKTVKSLLCHITTMAFA